MGERRAYENDVCCNLVSNRIEAELNYIYELNEASDAGE